MSDGKGYSGLIVPVLSAERQHDADGVWCFRFKCGHERLVAASTGHHRSAPGKIGCLECERQVEPLMHKFQVSL